MPRRRNRKVSRPRGSSRNLISCCRESYQDTPGETKYTGTSCHIPKERYFRPVSISFTISGVDHPAVVAIQLYRFDNKPDMTSAPFVVGSGISTRRTFRFSRSIWWNTLDTAIFSLSAICANTENKTRVFFTFNCRVLISPNIQSTACSPLQHLLSIQPPEPQDLAVDCDSENSLSESLDIARMLSQLLMRIQILEQRLNDKNS